jgi:hypothetical protein
LPYEYENYQVRQKRRFEAVPGLTGLWQVSGKNNTTFAEMIDLDIFYVEHKSFWLDLGIMVRTIPAVILQVIDVPGKRKSASAFEETSGPNLWIGRVYRKGSSVAPRRDEETLSTR